MARGGCVNEITYKKIGGGRWRPQITWTIEQGITSTLSEQISSQPLVTIEGNILLMYGLSAN